MSTWGDTRAASAWTIWARPISPPSGVTPELLDMFCALNGATLLPILAKMRHRAAVVMLFPTSDAVPRTAKQGAVEFLAVSRETPSSCAASRISCPLQKNPGQWLSLGFPGFFHKMAGLPASASHLHVVSLQQSAFAVNRRGNPKSTA